MKKIAMRLTLCVFVAAGLAVVAALLVPVAGRYVRESGLLDQKFPPLLGEKYPEDASPTETQKQWALATCAVLTYRNGRSHDVLGGQTEADGRCKQILSRGWNIKSREDLLNMLRRLEYGGHRKEYDRWVRRLEQLSPEERGQVRRHVALEGGTVSNRMDVVLATRERFKETGLAGWDFSRYVSLCGWGFRAGYLTEEEAWALIMPAARLLQKTFSSWADLADNYVEGHRFWSLSESLEEAGQIWRAVDFLRWNPHSPWARLKWETPLTPAVQKDDGSAEFRAGRSCYYGFGNRTYDKGKCGAEAVRLFTQATEKGNVDAMFWLGLCHRWGVGVATNATEACNWYQKAAELGDGQAQYELAISHYFGQGRKKDSRRAAELIKQAVTNGAGAKAEAFLGWCYEEGFGLEKSIGEAVKWYQKASDKGDSWAQVNYGECFSRGAGVERSQFKAAKWFKWSATGGNADGMFLWAECLEKGCGTVKDVDEAFKWYRKAAAKGHGKAKKRLAETGGVPVRGT